jgi:Pyrimidine dimer DNA glycosylase
MRLWTIHPRYLDAKGLTAAWREALLAQKVLAGKTKGYRHHPQLIRFQEQSNPPAAIASFLRELAGEAQRRGYNFDASKISRRKFRGKISETRGQLLYEWKHLKAKLRKRSPLLARQFQDVKAPEPHPLFRIARGKIRSWEKIGGK